MYKSILRPILFTFSPEKAHNITLGLLKFTCKIPGVNSLLKSLYGVKRKDLSKELFGIKFPNPVGLAAGLDKNGEVIQEMSSLGFGFIEVGTVTPKPQAGNPQPRLFRLPKDKGLINRMGFNNHGLDALIENLKKVPEHIIVGGNIGKNKVTPNENALDDYVACFNGLFPHVDYFVVNVSSPNTPGLRELQEKEPLTKLLSAVQKLNDEKPQRKPILLKIAPDLTEEQLDDIIEIVQLTKLDGLIATNTTISREGLQTDASEIEKIGNGGLSGKPVANRSTEVIRYIKQKSSGSFPIVGVGGICTALDAQAKLDAGADLVQVYSGFVYEGPGMVKRICRGLS